MPPWVPAALAFSAFGANLLTGALLLLFNPRNRGIRWYVLFVSGICAWLLSQGVLHSGAANFAWHAVHDIAVALLPGLFLAAAFSEGSGYKTWYSPAAVALNIALLPMMLPPLVSADTTAWSNALMWAWQILGWGGGAVLHYFADWRKNPRSTTVDGTPDRGGAFIAYFLIIAPLVVIGAQLAGSSDFFAWIMPPLTIVIQFMIFAGVTRNRYYDIEVRAARSGEIATRAAETERLAVLGEVAASIAHEVRNPLTGMRSLAQRIAADEVDAHRRSQYATIILDEIGRIERMVTNLLGLARRSPSRTAPVSDVDLDALFSDLVLLTASQARSAGVSVRTTAQVVHLRVAREPLAQALLNLLINAIAHTPPGGTVTIGALRSTNGVDAIVRDSGPGVREADRNRIFEPFHTTRADGSGLGLTVVRRLASELDWTVAVRDAAGGGAEFVITIPTSSRELVLS